jgi:hypothetical protein
MLKISRTTISTWNPIWDEYSYSQVTDAAIRGITRKPVIIIQKYKVLNKYGFLKNQISREEK